jgi:hypothetical protein
MSEGERQIVWDKPRRGPDGKPAEPDFRAWGARYQGNLGLENEVKAVLSIPEFKGAPQAIGVNLFRSDRQATLYNSDVRARVTYGAGGSGQLSFDCDWRGGFVVHATRLSVEFVSYKMPPAIALYQAALQVVLGVTAGLNGSRPTHAPTYTVLPEAVAAAGVRQIEIPLLARRVALVMRYGFDPAVGTTGDAPLGATFLSFADSAGNALAWLDASTTRASVFGEGLSIPAGAAYLGLSNNNDTPTSLGAIFHLGL